MAYECSFAGVPFRCPDPSVADRLERYGYADMNELISPYRNGWPGANLLRLGIPEMRFPNVKVNQFFYPSIGASRFSVFRGLMTKADIDRVTALTWPGSTQQSKTLKLYQPISGDSTTQVAIETPMYLLPPLPVMGVGEEERLYLVTLVDERYFWHWTPGYSYTADIGGAGNTFASLLGQLCTNIGYGLSVAGGVAETTANNFDLDSPFFSHYESAVALLDAILMQQGTYVRRNLDGTYTKDFFQDLQYSKAAGETTVPLLLGGVAINPTFSGVDLENKSGYLALVPRYVMVTFPKWNDSPGQYRFDDFSGGVQYAPYRERFKYDSYPGVYKHTINSVDILGTGISYFGGTKVIRTSAKARYTDQADTSVNNSANIVALSTYLAKAYLMSCRLAYIDETYRGIAKYSLIDWADLMITWDGKDCCTRMSSPPFNMDNVCEFFHSFEAPSLTHTASSSPPSGAAGGDLGGTYPNPTVANISLSVFQAELTAAGGIDL